MSMTEWQVEGLEFGVCNCAFGGPCQFEALPTEGHCHGFEVVHIEKGHFASVDLSGLNIALLYEWPGPVFEGQGAMQAVIDLRASEAQRNALECILHGGETEDAATHWWLFRAMSKTVYKTLYRRIDFSCDIEAHTARVVIPAVLVATGAPLKSPATVEKPSMQHQAAAGSEYAAAEMGAGSVQSEGPIRLDISNRYGQFNRLRHNGHGIIRR
ncbi:DUF1326 domain-containing protein [Marinobacterium jannaschii]|uniref:DUF1326 domain-containing protein n=1 Tax=Marinobacterium jannaschii TaxID=64970 RepID=UPI00048172DA|nr:DUF1326 domain-containing protein [Marinobacterium jannaschii]